LFDVGFLGHIGPDAEQPIATLGRQVIQTGGVPVGRRHWRPRRSTGP
jgi:hypothetical protein